MKKVSGYIMKDNENKTSVWVKIAIVIAIIALLVWISWIVFLNRVVDLGSDVAKLLPIIDNIKQPVASSWSSSSSVPVPIPMGLLIPGTTPINSSLPGPPVSTVPVVYPPVSDNTIASPVLPLITDQDTEMLRDIEQTLEQLRTDSSLLT